MLHKPQNHATLELVLHIATQHGASGGALKTACVLSLPVFLFVNV